MNNRIKSIYTDNLLGKIEYEPARKEVIEICVYEYLIKEFHVLNNDKPDDSTEIIEMLIILPTWFGIQEKFIFEYNRLLIQNWHTAHEWLIDCIMKYKDPASIRFICEALQLNFTYFPADTEYASFIRKCMWTLADINTPESIELLQGFRLDKNAVISKFADEQIRWLNGDKGMRYMP